MIRVNGEDFDSVADMTVAEFLKAHDYPDKMIAVECNGRIIPRKEWALRKLADGDTVEIVRFVGGG